MSLLRRNTAPPAPVADDPIVPSLLGALVVDDDTDDLIGPFADAKARYDDLLGAWLHGEADKYTTGVAMADVRIVAANGTEWTIGASSGLWYSRPSADGEWVPAPVPDERGIEALEAGGPLRCAWIAGALDQPAAIADDVATDSVGDTWTMSGPATTGTVASEKIEWEPLRPSTVDTSRADDDLDEFFGESGGVDLSEVLSGDAAADSVGVPAPSDDDLDAGWYEDPDDPSLVRWWDGTDWTVHTQANPNA